MAGNSKMNGQKPRAATLNLGCKVNHYETEAIRQQLTDRGFSIVPFEEWADVYVVNTCTVTAEAARKSRQMTRRARRLNPQALVVAVGCDVEMEREMLDADIMIGNKGKSKVAKIVCERLSLNSSESPDSDRFTPLSPNDLFENMGEVTAQNETRATVKIQDGCDNFCSYCAIPYVRGRVRSRLPDQVVAEVESLAAHGFVEIVLTGIHVCSYGKEWQWNGPRLLDLADRLSKIDGIRRIRLGSIEPNSVTREFARRFAQNAKLCPHLHLSLQSGARKTLERMNRNYDPTRYRKAVGDLRAFSPQISLTTDVIVGFPGESADDHLESLEFCRSIGFNNIHVFRYSVREGTVAARLPNRVSGAVAEERSREFLALAGDLRTRISRSLVGTIQDVLLEQKNQTGYLVGYSAGYIPILVSDLEGGRPSVAPGNLVRVRVIESQGDQAIAVPLPETLIIQDS
ncbi:MAG: tRNA (N(6)-L-threonylcarbamoyladenosine(37)-C(2))-methylthiotransferase MtaB [Fastidiosipilaceae bacterium]|jgi:threonylcarbamoyladenosine tRNA methylthiotransferase MtaB